MCGIAGIFNYAEPDRPIDMALLREMTTSLSHRGPDADGFFVEGPIGLGHRRLSIVDLSATGAQPMLTGDRGAAITYNGEIYNHREFRERLTSRGTAFRGSSDTETLLHVMREFGPDSLEHASGIFAFAYWDNSRQTLTLVRDPLGVKQLYFHDDGRRIIFASEIKALLHDSSIDRAVDPLAVSEYLHFHTPLFERTFFKGVRQVPAGQWIRFHRNRVEAKQYWSVKDFSKSSASPSEQVHLLRDQLSSVVRQQLMADVPVTAFFSGGIDSTAVASFASRAGGLSEVFGVHFANQGVVDERPYQEQAARALGLKLNVTTLDGGSFPSELERLLYFQDQPVIGPAMLPMHAVSKLAAARFKVCLGGQASDEVFGGYARYALGRPMAVVRNWFAGTAGGNRLVGGNLSKQLSQPKNVRRLLRTLRNFSDWQTRYFETFAKVPLSLWEELFDDRTMCDREHCRRTFQDETNRSQATDPTDRIQEWDLRTYLTGLFQQDDRMSMSVGLESRVPLADPRLVRHAFTIPFDLKLRRGATKWILREAISDIVPETVLNRVKVGFDTPVAGWMAKQHSSFMHDVLLSSRARQRGVFNTKAIDRLLRHPQTALWPDLTWKVLNIEVWSRLFLDQPRPVSSKREEAYQVRSASAVAAQPETPHPSEGTPVRNLVREVRELGPGRTAARLAWELKTRAKLTEVAAAPSSSITLPGRSIFADPSDIRPNLIAMLSDQQLGDLTARSRDAAFGRLTAFGHWQADYGYPISWHRNPLNGRSFRRTAHWAQIYADQTYAGDIKLPWEAGRFPQCFTLSRAAASNPALERDFGSALREQILHFIAENPLNLGVHWCNGQEVAFRLLAWTFALDTLPTVGQDAEPIAKSIVESTQYIEDHIEYAQHSVYNNHLISEAFGLLLGARLAGDHPKSKHWATTGRRILDEEADRQFYPDGAYISQSHNYHRSVLQIYLAGARLLQNQGELVPDSWMKALDRSLSFLFSQQNPADGRLPNYGGNDGAMPLILSECDYSDFRPTLQAVSALTRGELIYEPGPWDEKTLWLWGAAGVNLPRRRANRTSVSFADTGYHVIRGNVEESFATFRCGSLKDRFSQIDMLHLDVWWRGHNVLVDTGSFLYNGPSKWHSYFYGTGGHNTVRINGANQMPHIRKFKCLYPTQATLGSFRPDVSNLSPGLAMAAVSGTHSGYQREFGTTHQRTVLFDGRETWIVLDDILGGDWPTAELFWHGGEFPYHARHNGFALETPAGEFHLSVFTGEGQPLEVEIACGEEAPPAGWISRYYAVKQPIPRIRAVQKATLPSRFISVLSPSSVTRVARSLTETTVLLEDMRTIVIPHSRPEDAILYKETPMVEVPAEQKELVNVK